MPGLPQNNKRKPNLSFGGTKAIRDLMLVKNLPNPTTTPYFDKRNTGPDDFSDKAYRIEGMRDMAVTDQVTVDEQAEFYIDKAYLANAYGPPGGYGDWIQIYDTSQKIAKVNEGFYPNFAPPETGTGLFGENPFRQVGQYYSPGDILFGVTAEGVLSTTLLEDSELQQQGAIQLRKEFQSRIQQELYQETIGRLNFVDALKDPFKALDIITGRESLIERDNNITVPKSLVGKGLDFVSRLTGVYLPYSYIPGDYFELEPPRGLGTAGKIISDITGILGSLIGIPRRRQSPSQRFLDYTGGGTKSQLFKHIRYNVYGPQYGEGAQAQTAIGAGFGEAIDFIKGGILGAGNFPPNPPQYIGGPRNRVADMTSPPDNTYAGKNYVQQFGPDVVAKQFDENDYDFGLKGIPYINEGNVAGGFTWYTDKTPGSGFLNSIASLFTKKENRVGPQVPGTSQGVDGSTDDTTKYEVQSTYANTKSTNYKFKDNSLMDVTQQIVDSVPKGGAGLKSVSHAMNQVSKVFNDGYKELTKGARVKRFVNTDPTDGKGIEQQREYCRVWTKDIAYYKYGRLLKTEQNHRHETYSVLDNPYNLNIAPWRTDNAGVTNVGDGKGSTNIVGGKVKKYMFSLENLAWRTSAEKGFTYDDLATCEKGPNGGRIMWFPPYDLQVDESNNANWTENNFVGRPEPVYTYNNTNRSGTLRFKIVVDHPSVLNLLVRKELLSLGNKETDAIIDSFFAGCKNYDIFDLARKWPQFSVNELAEQQEILNAPRLTPKDAAEVSQQTDDDAEQEIEPTTEIPTIELPEGGLPFYFENDFPDPNTHAVTTTIPFNELAAGDKSLNNESYLVGSTTEDRYLGQAVEADKLGLSTWFPEARNSYSGLWPTFAQDLYNILNTGLYQVTLIMNGSSSSVASTTYNKNLSERRLSSVRLMFENYQLGGKSAFKEFMTNETLNFPEGKALGEDECSSGESGEEGAVFSVTAAKCRKVSIVSVEIVPKNVKKEVEEIRQPYKRKLPVAEKKVLNKEKDKNTRRAIANKVLMKMVTECDYFDLVKESDEFIYDTLKEKFKFFHPAFHSITPEGLNSRLTFLNQCVRPGATIPVKKEGGGLSTTDAATNTAFGAPPICVLRVGDFYHSKIAIDNISYTYDDNLLDLNPEGIGVQPMIASVNITFKYLGGQGLKEPVSRLQNALSFNYFANTEMYDDRAILTVTDKDSDEAAWIAENQDLVGTTQDTGSGDPEEEANKVEDNDTSPNDGITIGDRQNPVLSSSGESGTILYQSNFKDINEKASNYLSESNNILLEMVSDYNYGYLQVFYSEKEWKTGNYYRAPLTDPIEGELLGIPKNWQRRIEEIVEEYTQKIKDETTYIQAQFETTNPSNSQKRKLKNFLEDKLEDADDELQGHFEGWDIKMRSAHIEYMKLVTPMNVVNRGGDGYIEEGLVTAFQLSGMTPVDATSTVPTQPQTAPNTLVELGTDYFYLTNVLTCYSKIMNGSILVDINESNEASSVGITQSGKYSSGGVNFIQTSQESPTLTPQILYEYFLFSNQLLDKTTVDNEITENIKYFKENSTGYENGIGEFFIDLKEALDITDPEPVWISNMRKLTNKAIALNENFYLHQLLDVGPIFDGDESKLIGTNGYIIDGLESDSNFTETVPIKPDDKKRELGYIKIDTSIISSGDIVDNLLDYNHKINSGDDTFNLKFT